MIGILVFVSRGILSFPRGCYRKTSLLGTLLGFLLKGENPWLGLGLDYRQLFPLHRASLSVSLCVSLNSFTRLSVFLTAEVLATHKKHYFSIVLFVLFVLLIKVRSYRTYH